MAAIITLNHFFAAPRFDYFPTWLNFVGVTGSTAAVILLDGLLAHISHKCQHRLKPFGSFFNVTRKQKDILGKLGAKKLKNYLPDLGVIVKFRKDKIADPKSKEYIYAYILESCDGELGHILGAFLGFLIVFIFPPAVFPIGYWLCFGVPVAVVNFVLCILPPLALRYNRYSLSQIYRKLTEKETNANDASL